MPNNIFNGVLSVDPTTIQTLTFSPAQTWDVSYFDTARLTLTSNLASLTITNAVAGHVYTLVLTQDGIGTRTAVFGNSFKFIGGVLPVLSTAGGSVDVLCLLYDGTSFISLLQTSSTSSTAASPYDGLTNIGVAYGLRRLLNSYNGSLIRVQRSSDNTQQDIGYAVNGALDTASLMSFVGSGNGTVVNWYEQSGTATSAIPFDCTGTIVSAGVLNTANGKPSVLVKRSGSNFFGLNGYSIPLSAVAVVDSAQAHSVFQQVLGGGSDERSSPWRIQETDKHGAFPWYSNYYDSFMSKFESAFDMPMQFLPNVRAVSVTREAAAGQLTIYENNVVIGSKGAVATNTPTVASFPDVYQGWANVAEFIFFKTVTSAAVRTQVDTIMKGYYNIV